MKATWQPRQAGTGDPSPENVRPITGLDEVTVTLSDGIGTGTTATLTLPSTVYGGEVDLATGEGVETWETTVLSGAENWVMSGNNIVTYISNAAPITRDGTCSHFKYLVSASGDGIYCLEINGTMTIALGSVLSAQYTTETWASYLAAQAAEGTPVMVAYKLATPTSITATGGQQINALEGVNTVFTDADGVTVTFLREGGNEQANVTGSFADSSDGYASIVSEMNEISISGEDVELTKLEIDYVPQVR